MGPMTAFFFCQKSYLTTFISSIKYDSYDFVCDAWVIKEPTRLRSLVK